MFLITWALVFIALRNAGVFRDPVAEPSEESWLDSDPGDATSPPTSPRLVKLIGLAFLITLMVRGAMVLLIVGM